MIDGEIMQVEPENLVTEVLAEAQGLPDRPDLCGESGR